MIRTKISPLVKVRKAADLLEQPVVIRINKFTDEALEKLTDQLARAHETGQPVIPVVIDSFGGAVYTLFGMIDRLRSATLPVATVCEGKAMSAGAVLLSCGTNNHRYMGPNSTIMIHDVCAGTSGKVEDMKVDTDEAERLNEIAMQILAKNCGKKSDFFLKLIHERGHTDWFINPKEAKKYGLVNHVRLPKFSVNVSVEMTFE